MNKVNIVDEVKMVWETKGRDKTQNEHEKGNWEEGKITSVGGK